MRRGKSTLFVAELLCGGVELERGGQSKTNIRPLPLLHERSGHHDDTDFK